MVYEWLVCSLVFPKANVLVVSLKRLSLMPVFRLADIQNVKHSK